MSWNKELGPFRIEPFEDTDGSTFWLPPCLSDRLFRGSRVGTIRGLTFGCLVNDDMQQSGNQRIAERRMELQIARGHVKGFAVIQN